MNILKFLIKIKLHPRYQVYCKTMVRNKILPLEFWRFSRTSAFYIKKRIIAQLLPLINQNTWTIITIFDAQLDQFICYKTLRNTKQ